MRESQKMSLDYKLHTKIIESIVKIQRWFKTKLQKSKYVISRQAAIKIQSFWRMHLAQKLLSSTKLRTNAAITIQSAYRMFRQRRTYTKLQKGTVLIQAHARGKLARKRFQKLYRQKMIKERYKLRSTQSLPIDKTVDIDTHGGEIRRSYSKLARNALDLDEVGSQASTTDKNIFYETEIMQNRQNPPINIASHRAEIQLKHLNISPATNDEDLPTRQRLAKPSSTEEETKESVDSKSVRSYNLEHASKQSLDENLLAQR